MARYQNKWAPNPRKYMMDKDKPPLLKFLLTLLYGFAEYEPRLFMHKRRPFSLQRGQLVTSHKEISEHLHLNDSRYRQAGRLLEYLAKDGEIKLQYVKNAVIITLLNYPESLKSIPNKPEMSLGQSFSAITKGDVGSGGVNENLSEKMGSDLGSEFPCPTRDTAIGVESHGQSLCPLLRNSIISKKSNTHTIPINKTYSVAAADPGEGDSVGNLNLIGKGEGGVVIPIQDKNAGRGVAIDQKGKMMQGYQGADPKRVKEILERFRQNLHELEAKKDRDWIDEEDIQSMKQDIAEMEQYLINANRPGMQMPESKPHETLVKSQQSYNAIYGNKTKG